MKAPNQPPTPECHEQNGGAMSASRSCFANFLHTSPSSFVPFLHSYQSSGHAKCVSAQRHTCMIGSALSMSPP